MDWAAIAKLSFADASETLVGRCSAISWAKLGPESETSRSRDLGGATSRITWLTSWIGLSNFEYTPHLISILPWPAVVALGPKPSMVRIAVCRKSLLLLIILRRN